MNLRAQALLLTGFLAALKNQELNADEQQLISTNLNTPETLAFLMLTAAAYRRTKTLDFLSSLKASSKSVEQWITSQTISNIFMQEFKDAAIPNFDAVFDAAIGSDDADYIEFLATAISVEVSAIIIAKLIALPAETKLKLKKIQAIVVALNEDVQGIIAYRDSVSRFVQAIVTGDLAYICGEVSGKFDIQYQAYFVLLAAAHQKTPALRSLVEHRQFPIVAVEQWVQGVAISMPDYCPVKIETDCKTALLKAVQAGDLAYLRQMKPFLNPKLCALLQSESVQVDLTLAATAADNEDMLEFLTKELACVLVEKDYDWRREGVYEREYTEYKTHSRYEQPKPEVIKETVYPDASDSLPYRHALLAAANKEKLKALAWLLNQSFKDKDSLIARCHAMTHDRHRLYERRPNLKAFFDARKKQCLTDMSSLPIEEIKFYIGSLTSGDALVSTFVAACDLGVKELVLASLSQLNNRIWHDIYSIGWSIDKQDEKHQRKYAERRKIQDENPFDQWLIREYIEPLFLRSDPRIPRLLNTEFEKFAPEYGSQSHFSGSLRRSLQALRVEHQKLVRITAIKNTFCESLQLSDEDQAFLAQALSATKYVNNFKLVRPIFESTLKNDNLRVFYAVFLPAKKDDDARELASCYVESWYGSGASTCLVEAARAEAVNIFRALHAEFGNHLLTREVRRQLRTICDGGKHPNIKSTLESVLAVTVVQQSIFPAPRAQEAVSGVLEKKM